MDIEPDTKDWTWVLERRCPECGFDASVLDPNEVATLVRSNSTAWVGLLAHAPDDLRARPRPDRWSALEYACHVRDVFELYLQRLEMMLTEDDPLYPNWDQDATAVQERYDQQDPKVVAFQLADAAHELAGAFDGVRGAAWERRGRRSDGAAFTVATFARYLIHDPIHHLHDVHSDLAT